MFLGLEDSSFLGFGETSDSPDGLFRPSRNPSSETSCRFLFSVSSVPSVVRKSGFFTTEGTKDTKGVGSGNENRWQMRFLSFLLPISKLGKPVVDDGDRRWSGFPSQRLREDEAVSARPHHEIPPLQIEQLISIRTPEGGPSLAG